jgi:myo-inositol 2-dehydrogenase / D-chiro-inositol 1-dehydrogenase
MSSFLKSSRRSFIRRAGTALLTSSVGAELVRSKRYPSSDKNALNVGLIGCGGRGSGAALQALQADPAAVLVAMGDIFPSQIDHSLQELSAVYPDRVKVSNDKKFIGFDAYQKVIQSDVDVILLATPPAFRPGHFMEAINAGKHVFAEKPVAIDAPGVRKILEGAKKAREKNLSVVSGFCYRYDFAKRAFFDRVHRGQIGDIISVSTTRNGGQLWTKPRQPDWTDMEYKLKNWLYYNWLSGDFICEMMVHSLDLMSWAMGDKLPMKATGTGGRQVRVEEIYGNVYDHFAIEFEYGNGVKAYHFSRQLEGCSNANNLHIAGTLGRGIINNWPAAHELTGKEKWIYKGAENNMYETEHEELFAAIRKGKPVNDGEVMANSSMLGVLGRMVAYTGQTLTWDQALNSIEILGPPMEEYSRDLKWENNEIAKPGITKFS